MKRTIFAIITITVFACLFVSCVSTKVSLEKAKWNLTEIHDGDSLVKTDADIYITFAKNRINGSTGLNIINFDYTSNPETQAITFKEGMMTKAAGSPEDMEIEMLFLENLFVTTSYNISGDTLTLCDADGNAVLVFKK